MQKKILTKNSINENIQFLSNNAIHAISPTHEWVIFTKANWTNIMEFLLLAFFWASNFFHQSLYLLSKTSILIIQPHLTSQGSYLTFAALDPIGASKSRSILSRKIVSSSYQKR